MWRCKGVRIRGWEVVGERMQLKIDNTVCGLMWGVWFARVVEEGVAHVPGCMLARPVGRWIIG